MDSLYGRIMLFRLAMRIPVFVSMIGARRFRRDIASNVPPHVTRIRSNSTGNRSLLIVFDFNPPLFRDGFASDWENYFDSLPSPAILDLYSRITDSKLNVTKVFLCKRDGKPVWLLLDESGNRGAIYYPMAI